MSSDSPSFNRPIYLATDTEHDAVGALELTAFFLKQATSDLSFWKWAIVALHNAVQGFMVLALESTWNVGTLRSEQRANKLMAQRDFYRAGESGDEAAARAANEMMLFGSAELAPFEELYGRIKSRNEGMMQFVNSRHFEPRSCDDQCMECLDDVRNEFMHFVPSSRHFLLSRFPAITDTGLHVISFLLNDSNNILFVKSGIRKSTFDRAQQALRTAKEANSKLQNEYSDLPKPMPPLCGSLDS